MAGANVVISMRYGSQRWDKMPFESAARILESHIRAEQEGCDYHRKKLNEDQFIASFWSEVFGGWAKFPTPDEWHSPLVTLQEARAAFHGGQPTRVGNLFQRAVSQFNDVHRKWVEYRDRVQEGGETSIGIMEVTITALSAASGGAIAQSAKLGALSAAGITGTFAAVEKSAAGLGNYFYSLDDKVDLASILLEIGEEMLKSLIAGKLAEKFLGVLAPRLSATWKLDPDLAKVLARSKDGKEIFGSKGQKFITDFLASKVGATLVEPAFEVARKRIANREASVRELMHTFAEELHKQITLTQNGKQAVESFATNYNWVRVH